jgi:hypothetical protein
LEISERKNKRTKNGGRKANCGLHETAAAVAVLYITLTLTERTATAQLKHVSAPTETRKRECT